MSVITADAPACGQLRAEIERGVTAPDIADRFHAGGSGGADTGRRILDHDAVGRR